MPGHPHSTEEYFERIRIHRDTMMMITAPGMRPWAGREEWNRERSRLMTGASVREGHGTAVELERLPLVTNQRSTAGSRTRWPRSSRARPHLVVDRLCAEPAGRHLILFAMMVYQISTGVGVWGNSHPVMWGWDIINFVWWIGIGHAGTLISAILFLLRQRWRTAVNRAAEAMTIFAVMCAGIYPACTSAAPGSTGGCSRFRRRTRIWPQFRSPLMWDVFAVSTYFTVSLLFWYVGLIPDLAVMRDRAKTKIRKFLYGLFALGWTGSNRHWSNYEKAYLILAGLDAAGAVRALASFRWTSRCRSCRAGTRRFSRRISWRARSSPGLAWC
jgi:hypothetical protein